MLEREFEYHNPYEGDDCMCYTCREEKRQERRNNYEYNMEVLNDEPTLNQI